MFFGPQRAMVAAEVTFDPDLVTEEITDRIGEIEAELEATDSRVAMIYIEPAT
ncbi:hypothetical protein SY89_00389 [Halolamina pelagica]|uniref:Ferrous iron efflux protein F n=1 Tax=Halolamina pelagica TaxID=699431 RepID=A0A0P7GVW6_9EURY|nr:hypothetical protein SY89_00389 [Halolamina pelagica]